MSLWREREAREAWQPPIPAPLPKHKIQRYSSMGVILKFILCVQVCVCPHVCVHACIHVHHAQVWGLTMGRHVEVRGGFGLSFIALHLVSLRQGISLPPELTGF